MKISPIKIIIPATLGGITGYFVGKKIIKNNRNNPLTYIKNMFYLVLTQSIIS